MIHIEFNAIKVDDLDDESNSEFDNHYPDDSCSDSHFSKEHQIIESEEASNKKSSFQKQKSMFRDRSEEVSRKEKKFSQSIEKGKDAMSSLNNLNES